MCFDLFDTKKQDFLSADDLGEIMRAMGFRPTEEELKSLLEEIDEDGSGEIEIGEFCQLCATFLVEDPDMETMKRELKDAFRLVGTLRMDWMVPYHFLQAIRSRGSGFHHHRHPEGFDH